MSLFPAGFAYSPLPVRARRLAVLAGLVLALSACGGGGGGGDPGVGPAPAVQTYSSVYFTNPASAVAFVQSNPDGTGLVAYRNAQGQLTHADYLAKDKTIYHFQWVSDVFTTLRFDGVTLGVGLDGPPTTYVLTGLDGRTISGSMAEPKLALKADVVADTCVTNHRVQDETNEAARDLFGSVVDVKCKGIAKVMASVTVASDVGWFLVNKVVDLAEKVGGPAATLVKKAQGFLASNELQSNMQRFTSTTRQQMGASSQVIKTPVLANGNDSVHVPEEQVVAMIGEVHSNPRAPVVGGVLDWVQVKPVDAATTPNPTPTPTPTPTFPYAGTYNVAGGGVTVTFPVDNNGNIGQCTAGTLITCSGKVDSKGSFGLSGSDGNGTNATLTGSIDSSGKVTGRYTGTSDGAPISGAFTGSRSGGVSPTPSPSPSPSPSPGACQSASSPLGTGPIVTMQNAGEDRACTGASRGMYTVTGKDAASATDSCMRAQTALLSELVSQRPTNLSACYCEASNRSEAYFGNLRYCFIYYDVRR